MKFGFSTFAIMTICTGIAFSTALPADVFEQSTTSPLMGNHAVYSSATREVDESAFRATIPAQLEPDILKYFSDAYVKSHENGDIRSLISNIGAFFIATTGVMVLGWFAYDFFAKKISGGIEAGAICAPISALSPWLGFYTVTQENIKNCLHPERFNKEFVHFFLWKDLLKNCLVAVPTIITTLPLVFVTYRAMYGTFSAYASIFCVGTFLVFFQYYNKTTKSFVKKIMNVLGQNVVDTEKSEGKVLQRLSNIEKILDLKTGLNGLDNDSSMSINDSSTPVMSTESVDFALNNFFEKIMSSNGQELLVLLQANEIKRFIVLEDADARKLCHIKPQNLFALFGAACGIAGSYYFYKIGEDEIKDDLNHLSEQLNNGLSLTAGILTYICRGAFSAVTGYSCFDSIYNKFKMGRILTKESFLLAFMSTFGAISSTEMALHYLGPTISGYIFTAFTTISLISAGYWGQELFFEKIGYSDQENCLERGFYNFLKLVYADVRKNKKQRKMKKIRDMINNVRTLLPYVKDTQVLANKL